MPAGRMGAVGAPNAGTAPPSGPTYVGSVAGSLPSGNTGDLVLAMPSGIQSGDVAVLYYYSDGAAGTDFSDITVAGGWTYEGQRITFSGRTQKTWLHYRKLDGTEANAPIEVTNNIWRNRSAVMVVLRGINPTTQLDVTPVPLEMLNDDTPSAPDITTVTNSCAMVTLLAKSHDVTDFVAPANYTLAAEAIQQHSNIAAAYRLNTGTAGAQALGDWTVNGGAGNGEVHMKTVALRPA